MNFWSRLVLAILATWRVTHLLVNEDGPANIIGRFRARLGSGLAGQLMDCFKCLSLWVAAPAALFIDRSLVGWLFTWLGLSGAACLLERLGPESVIFEPASHSLEGEMDHVLRSESISIAKQPDTSSTTEYGATRSG
jgi:hypothetical protein